MGFEIFGILGVFRILGFGFVLLVEEVVIADFLEVNSGGEEFALVGAGDLFGNRGVAQDGIYDDGFRLDGEGGGIEFSVALNEPSFSL